MQLARKFRYLQILTTLTAAVCIILLINLQIKAASRQVLPLSSLVGAVLFCIYLWQQSLTRRLVFAPLEQLRRKVREIASDPLRLGETVAVPREKELGELATDFNELSCRLALQQHVLERRIEQRTAELREANRKLQRQCGDLRKTEERLHLIIQNSPVVLFAFDNRGRFTMMEGKKDFIPAHLGENSLLGASAYDLFGELPIVTPEGPDMTIAQAIDSTLTGQTINGLIRIEDDHFDLHCHPVFHEDGTVREGMGICFNVTDRIRMEARYRQLSQEFQGLLDGIPDSLLLLSPHCRIVWSNSGTGHLLGMEAEQLQGRCCRDLWCGENCQTGTCPCRRSLATGQPESARIRTSDGRVWGVKTFPLKESDGSIRGIIRWSSDITDRTRLEEDAMRNSHLAALGELAAGVAHEINNPNALILLNTSLLLESFLDALPILEEYHDSQGDFSLGGIPFSRMREEMPHLFSEMADGARRIRRIVDDLKNFVRQDPNEYGEQVDLNEAASAAARLCASTVRKSTGHFSMHLAEGLPPLLGNRQRLEQVIVNLLLNACHALDDPGKKIVLRSRLDTTSQRLLLKVVDQGVGIDPKAMPHITDPFFTTRRESGGTGLGLSVSARIVKEHGGSLHFDSQPGQGTTVTLCLPALVEDMFE